MLRTILPVLYLSMLLLPLGLRKMAAPCQSPEGARSDPAKWLCPRLKIDGPTEVVRVQCAASSNALLAYYNSSRQHQQPFSSKRSEPTVCHGRSGTSNGIIGPTRLCLSFEQLSHFSTKSSICLLRPATKRIVSHVLCIS